MMHYYLPALVFLPLAVALIIPMLPKAPDEMEENKFLHTFSTIAAGILFLFSLLSWGAFPMAAGTKPSFTHHFMVPWFPDLGISFALGMDGVSMALVVLTTFLTLVATVASYTNIHKRLRLYYSMIFILTSALLGVFMARDMFLFFLFYELELIPMYLLIAIWGGPRREYASTKFVLYTLFGSVFLLVGLLSLYFFTKSNGGDPSTLFLFDTVAKAIGTGKMTMAYQVATFVLLFVAFCVKLPSVPVHTWLPDAHVEAPTPVSMLLAGILLKMGAYGLLRFCYGFLPDAAVVTAPFVGLLAGINIVYAAAVALAQTDMKKVIAYSSVSHMGFVLLGLAALNEIGFNGAVFVMLSHGIVSAACFFCVGTLYVRTHSRMIADYGGFGAITPALFYFFLLMAMASLGLPFLMSFPGESLVFYGAFVSNAFESIPFGLFDLMLPIQAVTIFSALGVVLGAGYMLWLIKRVFTGPLNPKWEKFPDATRSETLVLAVLSIMVIVFGFCPHLMTKRYEADVTEMARMYSKPTMAPRGVNMTSYAPRSLAGSVALAETHAP